MVCRQDAEKDLYAGTMRRDLLPRVAKVAHMADVGTISEHFRRPWLDICFFAFDAAVEPSRRTGAR